MKNNPVKIIKILCVFLMVGFLYLFTACNPADDIGVTSGKGLNSSDSSASSSASSSFSSAPAGMTFGLYSESVPISVKWDTDTKMYVWHDYGANAALGDDSSTHGDGTKSLRIRCTSANTTDPDPWFGVGFSVYPDTNYRDLRNFKFLNFMYKGTKNFKIGVKDGYGDEAWLTAVQMFTNGCDTNGSWCTVKIPLELFSGIDYQYITQYFMICADKALGCASNDTHWVDNIYYSTN